MINYLIILFKHSCAMEANGFKLNNKNYFFKSLMNKNEIVHSMAFFTHAATAK